MLPKHVSVVSFAPPALSSELQDMLRNVQCDSTLVPGQIWLDIGPAHRNEPALLLLNGGEYPRAQIVATLKRQACRPFAVITPRENAPCDPEILTCCHDFIAWPCTTVELEFRLARLAVHLSCDTRSTEHDAELLADFAALNLVGQSSAFIRVLELIKKIARCDAAVLIEGETGTGKELAARAIHYLGARRGDPFIPVNCGAMPDNLTENELFGHKRGAYTDAKDDQFGLVEQAHGGTLFLDEIETLSPKGQIALLRFLQDQKYRPLGSKTMKQANVRIVAATNTSLPDLIAEGRFREDLFFRLNIMSVILPPLRDRTGDIVSLANHFIRQFSEQYAESGKCLHPDTVAWMKSHRWPGNVRELENFIHREFLLADKSVIIRQMDTSLQRTNRRIILDRRQHMDFDVPFTEAKSCMVSAFEQQYLYRVMQRENWNVTRASRVAGKERRALGKLLKKHNITKNN